MNVDRSLQVLRQAQVDFELVGSNYHLGVTVESSLTSFASVMNLLGILQVPVHLFPYLLLWMIGLHQLADHLDQFYDSVSTSSTQAMLLTTSCAQPAVHTALSAAYPAGNVQCLCS